MTPHPDQRYIKALLANDSLMLNEIYTLFAPRIRRMILQNNGSEADAADIFQEALVAIYQRARREEFVLTCPFDAYLYIVCRNRWINTLNKSGSQQVTFTDTAGYNTGEDSFKEAEITRQQYERRSLLLQKLGELGEGCRQLLELSWSGLPLEEVANKLKNTYGYIRKKKSECMAKLAALVKKSPQFSNLQW